MTKIIFLTVIIPLFLPFFSFANGGDQRIVEGKYYINLSRAPFTPRVGVKTSMLASFVDIEKDKLIAEDLIVKIRIAKLGGAGTNKRDFLFEKNGIITQGGILELPYIFTESGLHEIFFDFAFSSDPQKVYEAPDFLLDIQGQKAQDEIKQPIGIIALGSAILGLIIGWFIGQKMKFST